MTYSDPDAPTTPESMVAVGGDSPRADGGAAGSTVDTAKGEAKEVADTAGTAATQIADTAKDQATTVATEAQAQASRLLHDAQRELTSQAGTQQQRAAVGLRSLGDELRSMAARGDDSGPATSLARQAGEQATTVADWLENREPGDVLNEVKRFARKRPGAFLALSAGAGLLAARLARGLTADSTDTSTHPNRESGPKATTVGRRIGDVPRTPTTGEPVLATPPSPDLDPSLTTPVADAPYPAGGRDIPKPGSLGDGRIQ